MVGKVAPLPLRLRFAHHNHDGKLDAVEWPHTGLAGLAILDTMKMVKCPVATYCVGQASSMGAILLASGDKGRRYALPHARIMVHQPWGGAQGKASDIEITARERLRLKEMLNGILAAHSGKSVEDVARDTDRDHFMSADEAKRWGIIDTVF